MPAFTAAMIPFWSAAAGAGATIYGARTAGRASRRAVEAQTSSADREREFLDRQLTEDRRQFDEQNRLARAAWDAEQARQGRLEREDRYRFETEQGRWARQDARATRDENFARQQYNDRAVHRGASIGAVRQLAQLAGITIPDVPQAEMVPGGEGPGGWPTAPPTVPDEELMVPTKRVMDPTGMPPMPEPGEDGLVEFKMPLEAYRRLAGDSGPPPIPIGGGIRRPRTFGAFAQPREEGMAY